MASIEPRIPRSLLSARYCQSVAPKAAPTPAIPGPSTRPRTTAEQGRANPPSSEYNSDDELDDPDAWRDALDDGHPLQRFERMLEDIGLDSDVEVGDADATAVVLPGLTSSNSTGTSVAIAPSAVHGNEGSADSDSSDASGSGSEEDESDGNGQSGAVHAAAREDAEVGSGSSDEEEEEAEE